MKNTQRIELLNEKAVEDRNWEEEEEAVEAQEQQNANTSHESEGSWQVKKKMKHLEKNSSP